jgi:hypothetical protein
VAVGPALDRSTLERLVPPSEQGGQRVAGIRFGAPRAMRLLAALGCAGLTFKAFSQAELRAVLVDRLGLPSTECSPAQLAYDLRKLRGKGVVRKVDGRHRYTLTDLGYRVTVYWTKLHPRLLTRALDSLEAAVRPAVAASPHSLARESGRQQSSEGRTRVLHVQGSDHCDLVVELPSVRTVPPGGTSRPHIVILRSVSAPSS